MVGRNDGDDDGDDGDDDDDDDDDDAISEISFNSPSSMCWISSTITCG